ALQQSSTVHVSEGSFTSFPLSRPVRFAPRAANARVNEWTLHLDITRRRTPGASMALTPSTTHGGHPASRGAPVATTMASSVRQPLNVTFTVAARVRIVPGTEAPRPADFE